MARPRYARSNEPLPDPLPPERRTVGQLVAESLRAYQRSPWRALAVGVPAAAVSTVATGLGVREAALLVTTVGALLLAGSLVLASSIVHDVPLRERRTVTAFLVAVIVFVPFPVLTGLYILPGLAWLSLVALGVPAALVEGTGIVASLKRAVALARVDFVHVLGGLATLVLLVLICQSVVYFLLREYADNTARVAATITYAVIAPVFFLGAAILYTDQEARLRLGRRERERAS